MRSELTVADLKTVAVLEHREFATAEVAGQLVGIPVLEVQDVLNPVRITPIPLSRKEIAGLLNLRGRIVTAVDVRIRMGLTVNEGRDKCLSIVVEQNEELYSLIVDKVGDVLNLPITDFEQNPPNLEASWAAVSDGVYRLDGRILLVLNVKKLLDYSPE